MNRTEGFHTVKEAANRLGYKSKNSILNLIKKEDIFPNAFKEKGIWKIPLSDVEKYEERSKKLYENVLTDKLGSSTYLSVKEVADRLSFNSTTSVLNRLKNDVFSNAILIKNEWRIPLQDVEAFEERINIVKERTKTCLKAQDVAERLSISSSYVIYLIKNESTFPNAFFNSGKWWIPLSDIDSYEKKLLEERKKTSLNLQEVAKRFGLQYGTAINLKKNRSLFPNAIKSQGVWRIPLSDIEEFEEGKTYLTVKQVADRLGYSSTSSVLNLINKEDIFPNAFKDKDNWKIPLSDIETIEEKSENSITSPEASERLNISNRQVIYRIKNESLFPNAFKFQGVWRIPLSDIKEFEERKTYLTVKQVADRLGYSSTSSVLNLINKEDIFPNAFRDKGNWKIPLSDLQTIEEKVSKCLSLTEVAIRLDCSNDTVLYLIDKKDEFPNAFIFLNSWKIPLSDVLSYEEVLSFKSKNFYSPSAAAKAIGVQLVTVMKLIKKNRFPNVKEDNLGKPLIPKSDVEKFISTETEYKKRFLSIRESAQMVDKSFVAIKQKVKDYFPNAVKNFKGEWRIPPSDIESHKDKQDYNSKIALKELLSFINHNHNVGGNNFPNTIRLYKEYVTLQFNKMSGSPAYIRDRYSTYEKILKYLVETLKVEVYFLAIEELQELISEAKNKQQKIIIPRFLNYCYREMDIEPKEIITIEKKDKEKEMYIYPPELFNRLYNYTKEVELHKIKAINDQFYANMWAYSLLLLTDFIRGGDLIFQTPNIQVEELRVTSLEGFSENNLLDIESQKVINQLYIHFRNRRASKTGELLTFIVSPDLVSPLAHALVISEFHRKSNNMDLLLGTFISTTKYRNLYTSGMKRHQKFYCDHPEFKEFNFKSRIMNRTVATYLFYSIVEEDGEDADLALFLTERARSHKQSDSTAIYIQATNKDGAISRISHNLFRRGHFGWLYNYLIIFASQNSETNHTLEERTKMIEDIRVNYSPSLLESLGKVLLNHISITPNSFEKKDISYQLNQIYENRRSIVSRLREYSQEEVKEIVLKLSKGEMPSKSEYGQCFLYPGCKYPKRQNCFGCEYLIPQNLILIELKSEINRLIDNIKKATNEVILERETNFLMHVLFLWKEARMCFGDEITSAYIPIEITWDKIEGVASKIKIN
ncbi:helix-turn-helix domain-containing protein [Bacillus sp. FJAT-45350]|uniref:helix-turn-helix domain-containing protein n=1 Tax=Bacillus sp. FJAT-45350 TaxID=2011014 RepID=UPI000BB95E10|nr:helix-turn-helix domain-containing protein [Bacillus sp. FJAT-45350]